MQGGNENKGGKIWRRGLVSRELEKLDGVSIT